MLVALLWKGAGEETLVREAVGRVGAAVKLVVASGRTAAGGLRLPHGLEWHEGSRFQGKRDEGPLGFLLGVVAGGEREGACV